MTCIRLCAAFVFTLIFAIACDSNTPQTRDQNTTNVYTQPESKELSGADLDWESIKTYTYIEKQQALKDYRQSLDTLDAKIDDLEEKIASNAQNIEMNTRELWKESAETLRDKRAKLGDVYHKLRSATQENWQELQASFESNWNELEERWDSSRQAE
ncbi:MAG: hypothetical protein KC478_02110 [Bacteriovoracaceae bacterium]|nr:hypothetical protein [Bacteriovoracaceae bacterium]